MPNSIDNTIATISTKSPRDAISLIHFHAIVVYLTIYRTHSHLSH